MQLIIKKKGLFATRQAGRQAGRHSWFYYTSKQSVPYQMTLHNSNATKKQGIIGAKYEELLARNTRNYWREIRGAHAEMHAANW
jgi:hypothetical protein